MLSSGRTVRQITIDQPVIEAIRTPQGWNVARLLKPRPPADPNKPRATFTLPEIRVTNARGDGARDRRAADAGDSRGGWRG